MSTRVSVLMCAYNGAATIAEAVGDIIAQDFADWELVISDDCSTDDTAAIAAGFGDTRIRLVRQERNLGYVANKNAALALARGEWITQLDQDDRCPPHRLSTQLAALDRTGLRLAGTGFRRIGLDGSLLSTVAPPEETAISEKGEGAYPFWFPSLMVHGQVYDRVGGYDPFFAGAYGDDLYWTVRANAAFPILALPDLLYDYRDTPASITSLLDNPRKLVMGRMLDHLIRQRHETGTDDLEQGRLDRLAALERDYLADRPRVAEAYRTYAARSIDAGRLGPAWRLLGQSLKTWPWQPRLARTFLYFLRRRFS